MKKGYPILELFKGLLTILCCLVGLCCFSCKADSIKFSILTTQTLNGSATGHLDNSYSGYMCLVPIPTASSNLRIYNSEQDLTNNTNYLTGLRYGLYCRTGTIYLKNNSTSSITYNLYNITRITTGFDSSCPTCPDQYTSLECQSEYSLIPISSVDQSYCVNNNLCPSGGGGECESGSVNWSSIYVNNIQHIGKPNIFITIPEEIDWDYTNNTGSFDLDIIGYNVDYEKMSDILEVQNYKPSSEDFTNLVGLLAPYMSILVFCLFAYIIIKRLKKPFSSKLK